MLRPLVGQALAAARRRPQPRRGLCAASAAGAGAPAVPASPTPPPRPAAAAAAARAGPKRRLESVVADGWTALGGKVLEARSAGVLVDVGCQRPGLLPARGHFAQDEAALAALRPGEDVTVYAHLNQRGPGCRKLTLSLSRRSCPRLRWAAVSADGLTPYAGVVSNIVDYGAFVDIGCEVQGLLGPPRLSQAALDRLRLGDEVTVYISGKYPQTRKLELSLERRDSPLMRLADVLADGRTPYEGRVQQVNEDIGTFVDIGAEMPGLLPGKDCSPDEHGLRTGDRVTVYVVQRSAWKGQLTLALRPLAAALRPLRELAVDGQTPYRGVVQNTTAFGSFVDLGFETLALLPARDALEAPGGPPQVGSEVVVYVVAVERDKDKVTVSLRRSPRPLERFHAVVADGRTPYRGRVVQNDCGGLFVDIGCERAGFLPCAASDGRAAGLGVGDELTVYIVEKSPHSMRLWLSLTPREQPLAPLSSLAVDGQTPHEGVVRWVSDVGAAVDLGLERSVLLPRDDMTGLIAGDNGIVTVGARVVVYAMRKSKVTGKAIVSLLPSDARRMCMSDVAVDDTSTWYSGRVYAVQFSEVLMDFGCELSGIMPLAESPACARGDILAVRVVAYDPSSDRFILSTRASPQRGRDEKVGGATLATPSPPMPSSDSEEPREQAKLDRHAKAEMRPEAPVLAYPRTLDPPTQLGAPAIVSCGEMANAPATAQAEQLPNVETKQNVDVPPQAPAGRSNFKGQLQEAVMAEARVPPRKGDISYSSERNTAGLFVARVSVREGLPRLGGLCATGTPCRSKAEAEQTAAQAALDRAAAARAAGTTGCLAE